MRRARRVKDCYKFKWTRLKPHFSYRVKMLHRIFSWFQSRWNPRRKL